jgi:N-acetylglutamate synthase-like GNAT family acetyltransferase
MSDELGAARSVPGHREALPPHLGTGLCSDELLLELRPARDSDAEAVTELVRTAWSEFPGKELLIDRDAPDLVAPAASYAAQGGAFWVVERKGRIVASIALQPAGPATVELRRFYVARDMRRSGLGAALYRLFEDAAIESSGPTSGWKMPTGSTSGSASRARPRRGVATRPGSCAAAT